MRGVIAGLVLLLCAIRPAAAQAQAGEAAALDASVRAMCRSDVAVLGEADHWVSRTTTFKVALVRRLIAECGFSGVLFEAGQYDFIDLERRQQRGETITPAMVSAGVGGLWNRYREIQPLLGELARLVNERRVRVGGMDDQLGSAGALYENDALPDEMTALLPDDRRQPCRAAFRQWIYEGNMSGDRGAELRTCVPAIRAAIVAGPTDMLSDRLQMIDSIGRSVNRGGSDTAITFDRDRSMWQTFMWWSRRWPRGTRIIVWTHNVHGARTARMSPQFPEGGNLGQYISAAYGRRAFTLGFSAQGGAHGFTPRPIVPAELETRAMTDSSADSLYLDHDALTRCGRIEAGFINFRPVTADWSRSFDGAVLFREEGAPTPLSRS